MSDFEGFARESRSLQIDRPEDFPQGLKPTSLLCLCGAAKAAPFQSEEYFRSR
jgi:hypothetical protein